MDAHIQQLVDKIAPRLFEAAIKRHENNRVYRTLIELVNENRPLCEYFKRVCGFVFTQELTKAAAWEFRDKYADGDALEIIFDEALPQLEQSGFDHEAITIAKVAHAAVNWMCCRAHKAGPTIPVAANDERFLILSKGDN